MQQLELLKAETISLETENTRLNSLVDDFKSKDESEFKASDLGKLNVDLELKVERVRLLQLEIKNLKLNQLIQPNQ